MGYSKKPVNDERAMCGLINDELDPFPLSYVLPAEQVMAALEYFEKYLCFLFSIHLKYGRTVHIFRDDNPRLFNIPPRDSKAWKKECSFIILPKKRYLKKIMHSLLLQFAKKG